MSSTTQKLYKREEAAQLLNMSLSTFDRLRYAGLIAETRLSPHKIRFTEEVLLQYIDEHTGARVAVHQAS